MFAYEFVRNAYLAGTFIALACGAIGWFVVLRGQVFAGDALSHVAFVGAIGAAAIGVNERVGLFLLTIALAICCLGAATGAFLAGRSHGPDLNVEVRQAVLSAIDFVLTMIPLESHSRAAKA